MATAYEWGVAPPHAKSIIFCLSAKPGLARNALGRALGERLAMLRRRFEPDMKVLLGVAWENDPFQEVAGDRNIESVDAFLQLRLNREIPDTALAQSLKNFASELADVVDIAHSSLSAATTVTLSASEGDVFLAFVGRRRADISREQMSEHWLNHHAPLALSLMGPPVCHYGYDQLHVDAKQSASLSQAAGFPFVDYDMGDAILIPDLERFLSVMSDPDIARRLYEDELRFLDTKSWRGAFSNILYRTPG